MIEFCPASVDEWYRWLEENHQELNEVWLLMYKKGTPKENLDYEEALNIALCFGWVDVLVKSKDNESYYRIFKKKKVNGTWSDKNKERVERLIKDGLMHEVGLKLVKESKEKGYWDKERKVEVDEKVEIEFIKRLQEHVIAFGYFNSLSPSHQKHYLRWISSAKKDETKERRMEKAVEMLNQNKKFTG